MVKRYLSRSLIGLRKPLSNVMSSNLTVKDLWGPDQKWNITIIKHLFNNPVYVEDICKIYIPPKQ